MNYVMLRTIDNILIKVTLHKPVSTVAFSKYRVSFSAERIFAISFNSGATDSSKIFDQL